VIRAYQVLGFLLEDVIRDCIHLLTHIFVINLTILPVTQNILYVVEYLDRSEKGSGKEAEGSSRDVKSRRYLDPERFWKVIINLSRDSRWVSIPRPSSERSQKLYCLNKLVGDTRFEWPL
jgi:hypothetical protein